MSTSCSIDKDTMLNINILLEIDAKHYNTLLSTSSVFVTVKEMKTDIETKNVAVSSPPVSDMNTLQSLMYKKMKTANKKHTPVSAVAVVEKKVEEKVVLSTQTNVSDTTPVSVLPPADTRELSKQTTAQAVTENKIESPESMPVIEKKENKQETNTEQITEKKEEPRTIKKKTEVNRSHRVESGETLTTLAETYYKDKSRWVNIYEANKDKIEKGSLRTGDMIIIP